MRDIKFRGKNKDIGWVYGQLAYDINGNTYIIKEVELDSSYGLEETILYATMWYRVDKETIGQYTGLKDKNGKEIYEGDIVKCSFYPDFIFEIKFTELCWHMRKIPTSEHIKLSDVLYEDLEIIGNEFDNPELLEKGE